MNQPKPCLPECKWSDPPGPSRYYHVIGCPNAEAAKAEECGDGGAHDWSEESPVLHIVVCKRCGDSHVGKPAPAPAEKGEVDNGCGECALCVRCAMAQQKQMQALRADVEEAECRSLKNRLLRTVAEHERDALAAEVATAKEEIAKLRGDLYSACNEAGPLAAEKAAREKAEARARELREFVQIIAQDNCVEGCGCGFVAKQVIADDDAILAARKEGESK